MSTTYGLIETEFESELPVYVPPPPEVPSWPLAEFERYVYTRQYEPSMRMLVDLLLQLDAHYGALNHGISILPANGVTPQNVNEHIFTRLTAAITCLLSDPQCQFSPTGLNQILNWHRWLSTIFASTEFVSMDHILQSMNVNFDNPDDYQVPTEQLEKFCILYSSESSVLFSLERLFAIKPTLAVGLAMVLMSPRFLGSKAAHAKREVLLTWLPPKLIKIKQIEELPLGILHDVYMHCSYADTPHRHEVKRAINQLLAQSLAAHKVADAKTLPSISGDKKPVMLVVLEWFTKGHSIYRTHSRTLEAARALFEVVALSSPTTIDDDGRAVFDRVIDLDPAMPMPALMQRIVRIAEELNAQILYMPSVGMFPMTMFLANVRVAPVQVMALGHPATTHARAIDYVVVEEDYVGDAACFSEELIQLPSDGMPYRPSKASAPVVPLYRERAAGEAVTIAVASTTMKLNPGFLSTLAEIADQSKVPVQFHFLVGQGVGLVYPNVVRVIREHLGARAVVYPQQAYDAYMDVIRHCDLFVNPFPFGNTNGIIDTVSAGLVGICKTGPEVFEHIDQGLFERLAFPSWMVTHTRQDYIAAALRLIEDDDARMALRKQHTGPDKVEKLFTGRPEIMGQRLMEKLKNTVAAHRTSQVAA